MPDSHDPNGQNTLMRHAFRAEMYSVGINRCVDVPPEVSEALGGQTHIQVKGTVDGNSFKSNFAPRGGGSHRLFIHSSIWRKLGLGIGAMVEVELERDDQEWTINIPDDLAKAMPDGSQAQAATQALTIPIQKRFIDRIEEAKSPETRARRIQQGIGLLIERLNKRREQ